MPVILKNQIEGTNEKWLWNGQIETVRQGRSVLGRIECTEANSVAVLAVTDYTQQIPDYSVKLTPEHPSEAVLGFYASLVQFIVAN